MIDRGKAMMNSHLIVRAVPAVLAALLLCSTGVYAQNAPGSSPTKETAAQSQARKTMLERVDRRIEDLRTKLHITAAENPQWQEFATVMRENAQKIDKEFEARAARFSSMNAVENMQSYAAIAKQHAENMELLLPAFQKLYDSLSDEQKRTADEVWRSYGQRRGQRGKG
jgi:protein CpxP